jgi:hypothetical protein
MTAYTDCPASTFLTYVCDANDAFVHCRKKFTKKANGAYNVDSEDSLRHISCSILATVMGHFETYQKCLFAGMFERTRFLQKLEVQKLIRAIEKAGDTSIEISPVRMAAYRGLSAPVGLLVADGLKGWHSASKVNAYFGAIVQNSQAFTPKDIEALNVLWQLRHSIVHTGAWLTHPDAQKVAALSPRGDGPIVFQHTFINALARRLHKLVKGTNGRLDAGFTTLLGSATKPEVTADVHAFFNVDSPTATWLQ